jgi:hypothetical protein
MAVIRATPPSGEEPWLIRQFGPNTKDPMSATHWRETPMTGVQMMAARQNLLKEYPMNARFGMSNNSYASRRAGSNLLAIITADEVIRKAFGNWKSATSMQDVYTENRVMVSAKAKSLVAGVIQLTIKRLGKTDFRWGDIPSVVKKEDRDKILDEASRLYNDVKIPESDREFVTENMTLDLPAGDFLDDDAWTLEGSGGLWTDIHARKPTRPVAEVAPASSTQGDLSEAAKAESSDDVSSDS